MPQVGGRSVVDALRKATSAQAAVTNAARQVAADVAAERAAELAQLEQANVPGQALKVPAPGGTNDPAAGS
jgi:hypothetical protein